jgi:hypothetical protein
VRNLSVHRRSEATHRVVIEEITSLSFSRGRDHDWCFKPVRHGCHRVISEWQMSGMSDEIQDFVGEGSLDGIK